MENVDERGEFQDVDVAIPSQGWWGRCWSVFEADSPRMTLVINTAVG